MKFSAQEEYGLRCILQLARLELGVTAPAARGGEDSSSPTVGDIAAIEGLTPQYAGKLISILVKADLIQSVRGRRGGISLTRAADEVSVAEVLAALGDMFYEKETCDRYTGDRKFCVHTNDCALRSLWSGLQLMVNQVLSKTTLKDLCSSEKTMSQWMKSHEEAHENFHPISDFHLFREPGQREHVEKERSQ